VGETIRTKVVYKKYFPEIHFFQKYVIVLIASEFGQSPVLIETPTTLGWMSPTRVYL